MNPFNYQSRHKKIIELDAAENFNNPINNVKNTYIDLNTINLNQDDKIYRIFSLDKFIKTLENNSLCLVRTHKWEDPFENFLLQSNGVLSDGTEIGFDVIRDNFYGQCWTLRRECDGLWRNYKGTEPSAIKVKSTVNNLMKQFYDLTNDFHMLSYFIGKVKYVSDNEIEEFFRDEIDIMNFQSGVEFAESLLIKRLAFSYEEELRIIFSKPNNSDLDITKITNRWDESDLFFIKIDPNILFEEIELDPWISPNDAKELEQKIRSLGFTGKILQSSLYNKPFFTAKIKS
jgi:hypothetical protein